MPKVALIVAGGQTIQSFWCYNQKALTCGKPWSKIDQSCYEYEPYTGLRNIYGLPIAFEGGWFIRWENDRDLLDKDFDVIFLVIEGNELNRFSTLTIRERYPGALIVGYFKERNPKWHMPARRLDFLMSCDCVATPYQYKPKIGNKKVFSFPYPYCVEDFMKYIVPHEETNNDIFLGGNWWNSKRGYGKSRKFVEYLQDKHGFSVLNYKQRYGDELSWKYWLEAMARCRICINLDPTPEIGQEAIECAAMGVVHVGSNLDAHHRLFDSITGKDKIERHIISLLSNNDFHKESATKAFDKFQLYYSFKAARKNLEAILDGQ